MYITLLNQHIGTVKHLLREAKAFDCSEFMRFGEKEQRMHQMNLGTRKGLRRGTQDSMSQDRFTLL